MTDLSLWIQGRHGAPTFTETGVNAMSLTGDGRDIWDSADAFAYAYKTLNGNGSIVARVVANGQGSNAWAKGGVMIRDNLSTGSAHAMEVITGGEGGGANFQWRPAADSGSSNGPNASPAVAPPYWVKIERLGNSFSGYLSSDGVTWTQQGETQTIPLANPVSIGLCVTSHAAGELRTFDFDNIKTTGNVSGPWRLADIGGASNTPDDLYVIVQDSANRTAPARHADPLAVNVTEWTQWRIPLSTFTDGGVNLTAVKKMYVGVGDPSDPQPSGAGLLYIDDVRLLKVASVEDPNDQATE